MPVIPATHEAEAGELPEPRRQRLRWAEIAPLHSSLGNKSETPAQKQTNNKQTNKQNVAGGTNQFWKALSHEMNNCSLIKKKVEQAKGKQKY